MAHPEVSQIIKEVRRNGFAVEAGEGGTYKVLWKGEPVFKHEQDGGTPLMIHSTPSDKRWRKNMVPVLIRAKVLDKDPWSNHTEKKLTVTPQSSQSFMANQLRPWIQRRYDEGFPQGVLANAIYTRWPELAPTQNAVAVAISNIMGGKQKGLTEKKFKVWKEVVEGWSKQPALPPPAKEEKKAGSGNGEVVVQLAEKKPVRGIVKPSIPLSARMLAMSMDSYPDREEALLLHLELVEMEELLWELLDK
jgi:hypothetical protein